MSKRWAIASDPKLLARIAQQESERGVRGVPARAVSAATTTPVSAPATTAKAPSKATQRAQRVAENNQESRYDTMLYCPSENTLTLVLAGAKLLSLNVSLRMHDAKAKKIKETWSKRVQALMLTHIHAYDQWKRNATFPIVIEEVYASEESRCLDTESVTAACKPIVDALVRMRFLPDDSPDFLAQPIGYTFRQKPHGLVLVLRPTAKPWGVIADTTMSTARSIPEI